MEIIISFVVLSLVTAVISLYLKDSGFATAAILVALCGGILILLKLIPYFAEIFRTVEEIASVSGLKTDYVGLVIKVVGIAYIGEFAGELCRDVGEGSLAGKVDLGTKVVIMVMAMPLLETILSTVMDVFQ
ncbi:MAG: stage III sporulation protein AD [Clostridia bacterium]